MSIYSFDSSDKYWHDHNSYSEIGELHTTKNYAIVGKVDSRYAANKKKSIISPDSDRLLYNYFSNPDVKDVAVIEETSLMDEKQVFVGRYFLAIFDSRTGNFVCENPKSFLKDLIKPIDQGGLGYTTDEYGVYKELSADDFDSICANMSYAIPQQNYVYIGSKLRNGTNVLFRIDPYSYKVSSFHADGFIADIGPKMMYCKPFAISSNIYFLLYNQEEDSLECYCVDTFGTSNAITGYSSKTTDSSVLSVPRTIIEGMKKLFTVNTKIEGSIIALADNLRNTGTVYFFAAISDTTKACAVYNASTNSFTSATITNWPSFANGDHFIQASLFNDKTLSNDNQTNADDESGTASNTYIVLLSKNGNLITRGVSTSSIAGNVVSFTGGTVEGFFRSILKNTSNPANYEYILNAICKKTDGTMVIYPLRSISLNTNNQAINLTGYNNKNALLETYSGNITVTGNLFRSRGSNLIIGSYIEDGRSRPLIKDIGNDNVVYPNDQNEFNYPTNITNKKTFRKGLEPENGVSFVKNISFGNTRMTRVRILPEAAAQEGNITQYGDAEIFVRESDISDKSDGKFTTGSFLWKMLAKTGMPYNTHVSTIGRIILDGKDIPIEDTLITPPEPSLGYGNVLLTIDKLYDIACISNNFTKNGKALYPGILFRNTNGFLNDAVISNVYNVDGAFAYNDTYHGELFGSSDKDVGYFNITASCLVKANDESYLLVAANFGKLASINIKTGGFTKFDGTSIGENAPGFCFNLSTENWATHGNICRIEQYNNKVFLFYSTGRIYKTTLDNPTGFVAMTGINNSIVVPSDYEGHKVNINRVSVRCGDVVFFASNVDKRYHQYIECFDLAGEVNTYSNYGVGINDTHTNGKVVAAIEVGFKIYIVSSVDANLEIFDKISGMYHVINATHIPSFRTACSMVYDGNDMIYIVGGTFVARLRVSTEELTLLSNSAPAYTGTVVKYTVSGGNEYLEWGIASGGNITGTSNRYDIKHNVFTTINATGTIAPNGVSDLSTISKTGLKYYIEAGDAWPHVSDKSRDGSSHNNAAVARVYYELRNTGYISSLGVTSDGRMLIISFADGGIGSIDIPFGTYYSPDYEVKYKRTVSTYYTIDGDNTLKNKLIEKGIPTKDGYHFDHWSKSENGDPITEEEQNVPYSGLIYAVFFDDTEPYMNRAITRIFAKAGEFLDEGAYEICNVGNDVIFNTPNKTLRWSGDLGVFFRGRDDKFTNRYMESDKGVNNNNKPVVPMPICDAGICSVGKYIIYVNGYNKFAEVAPVTTHNGVIVYDTEYDEYAVMYTGEDNLHGTKRAKINPFCYYYDGYIYEFGGLERIDEHVGKENYHVMRRTNSIEQIDLVTGQIRELSVTFGPANPILSYRDSGNGVQTPVYSTAGKDELRYLELVNGELVGYLGQGKDIDASDGGVQFTKEFRFNLTNKTVTMTDVSFSKKFKSHLSNLNVDLTGNDLTVIPIPHNFNSRFTFNEKDYTDTIIVKDSFDTYANINGSMTKVPFHFGKYQLNKSLFVKEGFRVITPQVLPDGRLFIECEPTQNGNNMSEDSIVYRHLIVDPCDINTTHKFAKTSFINSNNIKSYEVIDDDLYTIGIDGSDLAVEIVDDNSIKVDTVKLAHGFTNVDRIKTVACSNIIAIFVIGDDTCKIFTFDCTNNSLKLRSLNDETLLTKLVNIEVIKFNNYFNCIDLSLNVSENSEIYTIQSLTNESHNRSETLNIRLVCEYDNCCKAIVSNKNETTYYTDNNALTVIRDNSGLILKSVNLILNSTYDFVRFNDNIVEFGDDEHGNLARYVRKVPKCEFKSNFVASSTESDTGNNAYIANDGDNIFVVSNTFNKIHIINKYGFMTTKDILLSNGTGENDALVFNIKDIAALNGTLYALNSDGKIIEYNINNDSVVIMDEMVSRTEESQSVKMCSDFKNDFIYIIKESRIYRYNTSGRLIKLYEGISFEGDVVNARYLNEINELRFVTCSHNSIKLYNYIFSENDLKLIKSIDVDIGNRGNINNICSGKYIVPINFDDNGNVYIFGDIITGKSNKISVLDGNTFEEFSIQQNGSFNDIPFDVSINHDVCYMLTKRDDEDTKFHIVKIMKPFNHIKSIRNSFVPGNKLCSNRTFVYNGETFVYGFNGYSHTILKFNSDTLKLEQYSNGPILDSTNEFDDLNVIGLKVFIGGIVYIVGINNSGTTDKARIIVVGYNLKTKTVDSISSATVDVEGADAETVNVTASSLGNWSSHYFTTVLHAEGSGYATAVTIDMYKQKATSTNIIKNTSNIDEVSALNVNGALAVFDGRVLSVGGVKSNGSSFNGIGIEYSAIHGISSDICESYEDSDFDKYSTLVKAGTHLKAISNNGVINIAKNGMTPFDAVDYNFDTPLIKSNSEAIDIKHTGENANYVIPCGSDCVIIDNDNVYETSDNEENVLANNSRAYQFAPSPAFEFVKNGFNIYVYTGVTRDIYISVDSKSGKIIDKLIIERDYGTSVKSHIEIDKNRTLIIHGDCPCVSTMYVHDSGLLSIKRYDGTIFGQAIDTGTNVHGIQEVDFTVLFDEEMCESDFRTVEGLINAD